MNVKFKALTLAVATLSVTVLFQNCGNPVAIQPLPVEPDLTSLTDDNNFEEPIMTATKECQFLDVDSISNILKSQFGIAAGDLPVKLTATTFKQCNGQNCMYLRNNAAAFGKGDIAKGIPDDYSCSTTKYKLVAEVFIHACDEAVKNSAIKAKLFPNGVNDYDAIYSQLVGRRPFSREVEVLDDLVSNIAGSKEMAVCSVVASSLEAVSKL